MIPKYHIGEGWYPDTEPDTPDEIEIDNKDEGEEEIWETN